MKYLVCLKNLRTSSFNSFFSFFAIPVGTVILWGADDCNSDGLACWTVTSCDRVDY